MSVVRGGNSGLGEEAGFAAGFVVYSALVRAVRGLITQDEERDMTASAQKNVRIDESIKARREVLDSQLEQLDTEIERTQIKLNELVTEKMRLQGAIEEYKLILEQLSEAK